MLIKSQGLLELIEEMLAEMPVSIKLGNHYGMLTAILSEYYIIKIHAEIKKYTIENKRLIKKKFPNCKSEADVLEKCRTLCNTDGEPIFLFEEISAIMQIGNLRNNTCAHTELVNSGHIAREQLGMFLDLAKNFLQKFDNYISVT